MKTDYLKRATVIVLTILATLLAIAISSIFEHLNIVWFIFMAFYSVGCGGLIAVFTDRYFDQDFKNPYH